jgi:Rps23 Pro-64 3,4-dihydroxylase Tpa1-like proline 4-hydroxylase
MLNERLDIKELAEGFAHKRRLVVKDALDCAVAERIYQSLKGPVPWRLAFRDTRYQGLRQERRVPMSEIAKLNPQEREALRRQIFSQSRYSGQYLYESFNLKAGREDGEASGLYAYEFLDFLESESFQNFARGLTGNSEINGLFAFAARYTAGNFHSVHVDVDEHDDRRYAFVFSFTKAWHADMGGLLHFLDEAGHVIDSFVPSFNALSIFAVPAHHSVSVVSPWVTGQRLTVTGWLLVR